MKLGGRLRDDLVGRFDRAVRWRADEQQATRAGHLEAQVREVRERLDAVAAESAWTANELRRLAPQLASAEVRLAELDERLTLPTSAHPEEVQEARSLVQEIRTEHERIRARLSAVARYEERLERLEHAVPMR